MDTQMHRNYSQRTNQRQRHNTQTIREHARNFEEKRISTKRHKRTIIYKTNNIIQKKQERGYNKTHTRNNKQRFRGQRQMARYQTTQKQIQPYTMP